MAGTIVSDTIQNGAGASTSTTNVINGCAKAWILYNGLTSVITNSFNVSSVTVNAVGDFTVNFTTAMPNANYAVVGNANTSTGYGIVFDGTSTNTTTTYRFQTGYVSSFGATLNNSNYTKTYLGFFGN
jgi:hypothetical protein